MVAANNRNLFYFLQKPLPGGHRQTPSWSHYCKGNYFLGVMENPAARKTRARTMEADPAHNARSFDIGTILCQASTVHDVVYA